MSFEEGKVNLAVFSLEENPYKPKELLEKLSKRAVASSDLTLECQGWASGKVLLDSRIDEESCMNEMYPILNWRKQYIKVDPYIKKEMVRQMIAVHRQQNRIWDISKAEREKIKEQVNDELRRKTEPTVRGMQVVIQGKYVFFGTANVRDVTMGPARALRNAGLTLVLPTHYSSAGGDMFMAGRRFLTWLVYHSNHDGVFVSASGPVEVVANDDKKDVISQCESATLRGRLVMLSPELNHAITTGSKLIRKAHLTMSFDAEESEVSAANIKCEFTFDADRWTFGGLTLPRECETFTERIVAIEQLYEAFERLFKEWKREEQHAAGMDFLPGLEE